MRDKTLRVNLTCGVTATMYTLAQIYDVGNQFLAHVGQAKWSGLPRTFDEYMARTYGRPSPDRFMLWNYGLLAAMVSALAALAAIR